MQYSKIKKPSVSIVIPAYNEEDYLAQCLDAIKKQRVKPLEVIVVDNNSSDKTADIAKKYPFVKLLKQPKQGVVFARDKGFDAAKGDIIGRIDVDTILPKDWVQKVQQVFMEEELDATSGIMHFNDIAWPHIVDNIDLFFRRRMARLLEESDTVFLQGSNMAIRRSVWLHIRQVLCRQGSMHEDFDLAIHLQEYGYKVTFTEKVHAHTSARRTDVNFLSYANYVRMSPHTYALHALESKRHMYHVVAIAIIGYLPARILYRGFDPVSGDFSIIRVFAPRTIPERSDPTNI